MSIAEQALQQLDRLGAVILEDVGDGPRPSDFAAAARVARDAVAQLAVPALTQLGGLISGVAESMVAGATEWNPSLGGTLMAAIDDLRDLASRADRFTDEDSEHLAHRAAELSGFVRADENANGNGNGNGNAAEAGTPQPESQNSAPAPIPIPIPIQSPIPIPIQSPVIPISELFYADAGPHIVSGGTPKEAEGRSDLLGKGIDALDNLTMKPIATPVAFGAVEVVPVETLLYRGRTALERAAVIREQIKSAGGVASPATLEEMYDLIGLALKD
jgi:hypothetical protein